MTNDQWQMKDDKLHARNESAGLASFHLSFVIGHRSLIGILRVLRVSAVKEEMLEQKSY